MPIAALVKSLQTETAGTPERTLTPAVVAFLSTLKQRPAPAAPDAPTIHVSSVASGAAVFYERLRYSLDFHEEHLLRRHALERMLRRRFTDRSVDATAERLLLELVQAQYLPNDTIPEAIVPTVQAILDRYAMALKCVPVTVRSDSRAFATWLIGLASAELDALLVPATEEAALMSLMASYAMKENVLEDWLLTSEERQTQVFIACYRALFAFDFQTLHYLLLERQFPDWTSMPAASVADVFPMLERERVRIEQALRHPAGDRLYRLSLKRRAVTFRVLNDIVTPSPVAVAATLKDERRLAIEVGTVTQRYYRTARRRLYRSAMRSTIYIFLTKVILAMAVEGPAERLLYGAVAVGLLILNLAFPPSLMLFLTVTTRFPGSGNTHQLMRVLTALLYGSDRRIFQKVKRPSAPSAVSTSVFSVFYLLVFGLTFGLLIWMLGKINYTPVGMAFFLFFLCIVSFFALRIRQPVRDLFVTKHRENPFVALIDFFSLPILSLGQWISLTSARLNIFLYLFDYFLEAPFKAFLLIFEDVLGSFREKREELL